MKKTFSKKQKYYALGAFLLSLMTLVYFIGPKSKLTLISRLHYNSLFALTPCIGSEKSYEDEEIKFNYLEAPVILIQRVSGFVNPFSPRGSEKVFGTYVDMNIPFKPSYKYEIPITAIKKGVVSSNEDRLRELIPSVGHKPIKISLKNSTGFIKTEGAFAGDGDFKFLYVLGKKKYVYRIAMPLYSYRENNGFWLLDALYNSGLLLLNMDLPPPAGAINWFLTPSSDKQAYCSANTIVRTLELKD